jgi:DNA primase
LIIPRETINLIRERAPIEQIIKRYIPSLKKRGNNFVGLCPFHKDSNPSFTVSPEKRIFHCFGCHEGGNIFTFISRVEGLTFPESVRFVANLIGLRISQEEYKRPSDHSRFLELNELALDLFRMAIKSNIGRKAHQYLSRRGVKDSSIDEFRIGYSPDSWNFLTNHLRDKGIPLQQAVDVGLLNVSEKDDKKHYYDKFRDRVIFPIISAKNEIIAFGGRIVDEGEPKYLNSPESEIFKKRTVLYGFDIARKYITEFKRVIIVEGYLDVIGCHQEGIKNVVAPLGTALTREQVELLSRYSNEIILLFDADSAGIKASLRSLDILEDKNLNVKIAVLPEDDPFEFIRQNGIREFMSVVDASIKPIEFRIQQIISEQGSSNRLGALLELFKVIEGLSYETERSVYLKKISSILEIDENSVRADFKKFLRKNRVSENYREQIVDQRDKIDFLNRSYRELVLLLCHYPHLVEKAILDFSENEIDDPLAKNIFSKLIELFSSGEEIDIDKMFDFFSKGEEKIFLGKSLLHANQIGNPNKAYTEIYLNLRLYRIDDKINKFAELIKKAKATNSADVKEYLTEIEVLRREKEKLVAYIYNKR